MKAAVYHGPRDVRVEQRAEPGPPAADEVTLRVARGALCGTDASEYAYGPRLIPLTERHGGSGHRGPLVLGHELLGYVEAVGAGVEGIAAGERVVPGAGMWCGECAWCRAGQTNLCARYYTIGLQADGGMTERLNVPAKMCRPVPGACDDDAAAIAQPLAVALHAVRRARAEEGELAVLIGVGGIGFFALVGLVARGARVIAVDVDAERLANAHRHGATMTFDARDDGLETAIREAADGPVDLVVEASGAPSSPALAQRLVRRGGRIMLIGIQKAPVDLDLADLVVREVDVITSQAHVCAEDLPEALEILATGDLAAAAIDRVVPLEEIVAAGLEPLAAGAVTGKVLVDPGS
jgi:(R,R)-butanediol dehydrogenase/meso-butanediol dehydrogenase/diacetyl reductase